MRTSYGYALMAGILIAGLAPTPSARAHATLHTAKKGHAPTSVLLVISAKGGNLVKTKKGYQLILNGVDKRSLWFADRPDRRTGFVKTSYVMSEWSKIFKGSQPNAGLIHAGLRMRDMQGNSHPESVELMHPSRQANGDVVFKVRALTGDRIVTGNFRVPVLFIDGAVLMPCLACGIRY